MRRDRVVVLATRTLSVAGRWFIILPNLIGVKSHGGGDDINNWDRDQTFMGHYN